MRESNSPKEWRSPHYDGGKCKHKRKCFPPKIDSKHEKPHPWIPDTSGTQTFRIVTTRREEVATFSFWKASKIQLYGSCTHKLDVKKTVTMQCVGKSHFTIYSFVTTNAELGGVQQVARVCVYGHHNVHQNGHQPGIMVTNPARVQLKTENRHRTNWKRERIATCFIHVFAIVCPFVFIDLIHRPLLEGHWHFIKQRITWGLLSTCCGWRM